jgi:hypothetical protein
VTGKPNSPTKRDTVLFAAIVSDLEGLKYCSFLDNHRVKPKWSDTGPKSYRESYAEFLVLQKDLIVKQMLSNPSGRFLFPKSQSWR